MTNKTEKKEYEIAFFVKNKGGESAIETLLKQHESDVVFRGPVVETHLAYPIRKIHQGQFGYMHFAAMPDQIEKIVHEANLNQEILRVLVTTPPVGKGTASNRKNRKERTGRAAKKPADAVSPAIIGGILTNEALEEKLEEILK